MSMEYEKTYMHRTDICPVLGYQEVKVGVPVEVKPFAEVGKVKTECIGKPEIEKDSFTCNGKIKETCRFTISQKIRIEVPVSFGAKTEVGQARVECGRHGKLSQEDKIERTDIILDECNKSEHICRGMIG